MKAGRRRRRVKTGHHTTVRIEDQSIDAGRGEGVERAREAVRDYDGWPVSILPHRGRGTAKRWRGLITHHPMNMVHHSSQFAQNIARRNTKDGNAACVEPFRPPVVVLHRLSLGMAFAVHLDRKSGVLAKEIQNVRTDGVLATKANAVEPAPSDLLPQEDFRQGHRAAQVAGASDGFLRCVGHLRHGPHTRPAPSTASPSPSPDGGGFSSWSQAPKCPA